MTPMNQKQSPAAPPTGPRPGIWTSWSRGQILGLFFLVLTGNFFFQIVVFQAVGGMFWPVAGGAVLGMLTGVSIPPVLFILLTMIGGATLVSLISSTIAYYIAYASFRLGLDPDNMVIPILTSLMDVVGSGSLILCILAVGLIL